MLFLDNLCRKIRIHSIYQLTCLVASSDKRKQPKLHSQNVLFTLFVYNDDTLSGLSIMVRGKDFYWTGNFDRQTRHLISFQQLNYFPLSSACVDT